MGGTDYKRPLKVTKQGRSLDKGDEARKKLTKRRRNGRRKREAVTEGGRRQTEKISGNQKQ